MPVSSYHFAACQQRLGSGSGHWLCFMVGRIFLSWVRCWVLISTQFFTLADRLIEVGLAESMPYGHLRVDPALPSYLLRQMNEAEQAAIRASWAEGMQVLTAFLYEQRFK